MHPLSASLPTGQWWLSHCNVFLDTVAKRYCSVFCFCEKGRCFGFFHWKLKFYKEKSIGVHLCPLLCKQKQRWKQTKKEQTNKKNKEEEKHNGQTLTTHEQSNGD